MYACVHVCICSAVMYGYGWHVHVLCIYVTCVHFLLALVGAVDVSCGGRSAQKKILSTEAHPTPNAGVHPFGSFISDEKKLQFPEVCC